MKLAYVAPYSSSYSLSANSIHVFKMCDAYTKSGVNVTLYLDGLTKGSRINNDLAKLFDLTERFKVCSLPYLNQLKTFKLIVQIPLKLKFNKIEVVHTRNIAIAFGCAVLVGIPTILELHNFPQQNQKAEYFFKRFCKSKYAINIICITKSLKDDILDKYFIMCPVFIFPDGVSQKYLQGDFKSEELKRILIPELANHKWIVYTGSFYKGKGPDFIIELSKLRPNLRFILIGNYPNGYGCKVLDNFYLIKQQPLCEIIKFQRAADILLLPIADMVLGAGLNSENIANYTSPLKMFEYMASKTPIVASNLSVLQEILADRTNAIICDINSIENWVFSIDELISNQKLANSLSERAFLDVQKFTWERRAQSILSLLKSI